MSHVPIRKIRKDIETQQHIYSEYEYTRAISPNIFLMVSGGLDSMFLLDLMAKCDIRFDVIHFVHGIRSAEQSMADLQLVHNTVTTLNKTRTEDRQITVRVGYGEGLNEGKNVEARAHAQRWEFVEQQGARIAQEFCNSDYVKQKKFTSQQIREMCPSILAITAHHYNDQIEQVFMRLMRGDDHKTLVMNQTQRMYGKATRYRPLINVPKQDIRKLAEVRGLKWNEDVTNEDNHTERNWLRNVILPQLAERRNLEKSMMDSIKKAIL